MKKTLLFTLGLLAASTTAWADAVDFLSTSGFKAYKIQARRGPNAAGTAFSDYSGKGFMLTNEDNESDLKAYANWYQGTTFFNETYSATNLHHNFLLIKADYGTFIYSLGKNAYLATGDDSSINFATTPTTATINTSGNDATYKYYITTSNNIHKFATSLVTPMPDEAIYYCHKLGDRKYMFTTKDGKYLMYATDANGEKKGMEDAYDANKNTLTLQPMSYNTANSYSTNNDVLTVNKTTVGLFLIRGKRAYNTYWANYDYYLMAGFNP